jgi:hypothetical protein
VSSVIAEAADAHRVSKRLVREGVAHRAAKNEARGSNIARVVTSVGMVVIWTMRYDSSRGRRKRLKQSVRRRT